MDNLEEFKRSVHNTLSPDLVSSTSTLQNDKTDEGELFPDLYIKMVPEIIGTGGVLSAVNIDETSKGYLTPEEWHKEMQQLNNDNDEVTGNKSDEKDESNRSNTSNGNISSSNTILVDCRNHMEYSIGNFANSIDPATSFFSQFPSWVDNNKSALKDKNVLMYCTGGIRCEKASAYIRKVSDVGSVKHLKGGIHKYLDKYGSNGYFRGKNYVFDGRISMTPGEGQNAGALPSSLKEETLKEEKSEVFTNNGKVDGGENGAIGLISNVDDASVTALRSRKTQKDIVVGTCLYCTKPSDTFTPDGICTVCRERTLVCASCRTKLDVFFGEKGAGEAEYHCHSHFHLKDCYFTNLKRFDDVNELNEQLERLLSLLDLIAVGKRYKQKRRTLNKQIERVKVRLREIEFTLLTQASKIPSTTLVVDDSSRMTESKIGSSIVPDSGEDELFRFRNCKQSSCDVEYRGDHALEKKEMVQQLSANNATTNSFISPNETSTNTHIVSTVTVTSKKKQRLSSNHRISKVEKRKRNINEIKRLNLSAPPSKHRNEVTSLRCPPPCIRVLTSIVKGRWCGHSIGKLVQSEFLLQPPLTSKLSNSTLSRHPCASVKYDKEKDCNNSSKNDDNDNISSSSQLLLLQETMRNNLLSWNNIPVNNEDALRCGINGGAVSSDKKLKNMDVLSRIVHWHEPPVLVPSTIKVTRLELPQSVRKEYPGLCGPLKREVIGEEKKDKDDDVNESDTADVDSMLLYVCDKPSTVPGKFQGKDNGSSKNIPIPDISRTFEFHHRYYFTIFDN